MPYRWYPAQEAEAARLMTAAEVGTDCIPVVITPEGEVLRSPSDAELAAQVGLSVDPAEDFYDVVVVGGGPAGLGAAVYAASEGLRTVLVERSATGGQAGQSSRIENYLGFPDGISGSQLAERARRQAVKFGAEVISARDVSVVETSGAARVVRFADGGSVAAHTAILATGVSYRQLEAPGAEALTGRGVFYGAALTEAMSCADQHVYVVGGANSAGQAALYFAQRSTTVTMLVRGPSLAGVDVAVPRRADRGHAQHPRPHRHHGRRGARHRPPRGRSPCSTPRTGEKESVDTSWLFIFIGAAPRTDWLDESVVRDEHGFVFAGPDLLVDGQRPRGWSLDRDPYHLETSVPGVFVAGDVRATSVKRVASAVGEGAMAVMLVHRYLERL